MEEARRLDEFLPISFKTTAEQEYLAFLWEAVEENYVNGKYQFSIFAYHMIVMIFFYFKIWQMRLVIFEDFEKGLIGFSGRDRKNLLSDKSPFVFSSVRESEILRLFRLTGCAEEKVGAYVKLVRDRNAIAHSSGRILVRNQESFDAKVSEVIRIATEIQLHQQSVIEKQYRSFLYQSSDLDDREHLDPIDQIREALIRGSYMSWMDLETCVEFDITSMEDQVLFDEIQVMHEHVHDVYIYGIDLHDDH